MKRGEKSSDTWIYDQVFGAILEQRLRPETKLTESELCDVFGVIFRRSRIRNEYVGHSCEGTPFR